VVVSLSRCSVVGHVQIGEIVWTQSQVDIFFIDWERDKHDRGRTREDDVLDAVAEAEEGKAGRKKKRIRYPQVSAWRSILAANEFSEMQTVRKTSLYFTQLMMLFFLRGLSLEYVATPQPNATDLTPGEPACLANCIHCWLRRLTSWLWLWCGQVTQIPCCCSG